MECAAVAVGVDLSRLSRACDSLLPSYFFFFSATIAAALMVFARGGYEITRSVNPLLASYAGARQEVATSSGILLLGGCTLRFNRAAFSTFNRNVLIAHVVDRPRSVPWTIALDAIVLVYKFELSYYCHYLPDPLYFFFPHSRLIHVFEKLVLQCLTNARRLSTSPCRGVY